MAWIIDIDIIIINLNNYYSSYETDRLLFSIFQHNVFTPTTSKLF